ncbi:MAG: zincin-like metallopeptidase domain-containing protein [Acidobacteriota bacterium]|nr:zincin-like metallopeptidase domain-containing protein [Acidobacteriota bacterium]
MLWRRRVPPPEPRPVLETFVRRVLGQLRNRRSPWQQHQPSEDRIWPERFPSRQPYDGVQGLHLLCRAAERGYSDPRWGTRDRIEAAGGRISKDQTGVLPLPARDLDFQPSESPPDQDGSEEGSAALFNVEQTGGLFLPPRDNRPPPSWEVYERVERLFEASGVGRRHEPGDRAYYHLGEDRIVLPPPSQFVGSQRYYQTLLHELGHGTGHPDRLNRPVLAAALRDGTGSTAAAREELRAEIAALMTGVRIGLGHRPRNGEFYTKHWIQLLESDPRELVRAAADAWRMSEALLSGAREIKERTTEPSSVRSDVREAPRIRLRQIAPVLASPPLPALEPPRPAPGSDVLERFGWHGPEAEWIALVCRHGGWFTRAQFCAHFRCRRNRALRFVRLLLRRRHGVEEDLDGLPTTTRLVRIAAKALYRALGLERVPHPRSSAWVRFRRLLSLDYVLDHPQRRWLPTGREKASALEALGLSRRLFPCRHYAGHAQGRSRYFPRMLPLALKEDRATFVYVDPGRDTDSELLSWGAEHARLWAALRAQDHPVHVVAVARDDLRRERAEKVLRRWSRPGPEAEFQPLFPEEEQIIRRIEQAALANDQEYLARYGGFVNAMDHRQALLERATAPIPKNRIRIDRGRTWLSVRIPAEPGGGL